MDNLLQEYYASEGYRAAMEIAASTASYRIFATNHEELRNMLLVLKSPGTIRDVSDEGRPRLREAYAEEVARRLHNYLASASSLVAHRRNFVRGKYRNTELWDEYQGQVDKRFAHEPLARFVQDFRNYILHKSLPATALVFKPARRRRKTSGFVALRVGKLLEWDRWSGDARRYLATFDGDANLRTIVDDYAAIVTSFHRWYVMKFSIWHIPDFKETDALESRIRAIDPAWRSPFERFVEEGD